MRLDRAQGDVARGGRPAFTLIELLVVIVIIGLLIAAIGMVGSRVMQSQREKATQNYMRAITAAIDQFAQTNPLRLTYDTKRARSFGPYPPYPVYGSGVSAVLEPNAPTLADRLRRDLRLAPNVTPTVAINDGDARNNDVRALYTYLAVLGGDALSQVPPAAIAKLPAGSPEMVNPGGGAAVPGAAGAVDVLGFYDVWQVPLDYLLYVRIEWKLDHTGLPGWRVTDRRPVLRSRGVPKEAADAGADTRDDWIFSTPLPSPVAAAVNRATGAIVSQLARDGGWVRAVGAGDLNPGDPETRLFGFVP